MSNTNPSTVSSSNNTTTASGGAISSSLTGATSSTTQPLLSRTTRQRNQHQRLFHRQATILRRNLYQWDHILRAPQNGEDWPQMLGRLNAAMNQASNMNDSIEDLLEHFVYIPKKCPANPQDVPFFLSTRLVSEGGGETEQDNQEEQETEPDDGTQKKRKRQSEKREGGSEKKQKKNKKPNQDTPQDTGKLLRKFEEDSLKLVLDFENSMVRF